MVSICSSGCGSTMKEYSRIVVYTCIGNNSAPYAEFLKHSMETLKSDIYSIEYKCVRTVGHQRYGDERLPVGWEHISDTIAHKTSNSFSHAKNIDSILKDISSYTKNVDETIFMICDSDVAFLYRDWDSFICDKLGGATKFICLDDGKGLPSVFVQCFNADGYKIVCDNEISYYPKLGKNGETCLKYRVSDDVANPVIKCDTGYELKEYCYHSGSYDRSFGCEFLLLPKRGELPYTSSENKALCLEKPTHMATWSWGGILFCTHLQACRSDSVNSDYGKAWVDRVSNFNGGLIDEV